MSALLDAVVAKVIADRTPAPRVYKINQVPAEPGYPYSVIGLVGDQPLAYTLDQTHGFRDWGISVRSFGHDIDGAQAYDAAATRALLDRVLVVAGWDCGPIRFQLSSQIDDPDDSRVVGISTALIFTATEEAPDA